MNKKENFVMMYSNLVKACEGLAQAMELNTAQFKLFEIDVIKNGQVQKFEYTIELLWKTIKKYYEAEKDVRVYYPKDTIKKLFEEGLITEEIYILLFDALETRNYLSHIYNSESFEIVYPKIKTFIPAIKFTIDALKRYTT